MVNNILVLDTNIFSGALSNLNIDIFDDIYNPWIKGIQDKIIISVDEVFMELERFFGKKSKTNLGKEYNWLCKNKIAFQNMSTEESIILSNIYQTPKFREGVKEKSIRNGTPESDAILVAKAIHVKGVIVTSESFSKPNSSRIPNICECFAVPFITRDDFYYILKRNLCQGNDLFAKITLKYKISP